MSSIGSVPTDISGQPIPSVSQYLALQGTQLGNKIKQSEGTFYAISTIAIVASALFIATSAIAISVYDQCSDFGGKDNSGLRIFFIIMLVVAILVLIGAIVGLVLYTKFYKPTAEIKRS